MSGQRHTSEATCPTCGNDEAIVRVRGNAFSSVCTVCRRADVSPLLDSIDLVLTEGETMEAELFELEAVRSGQSSPLSLLPSPNLREAIMNAAALVEQSSYEPTLQVELRLPVPPR